MTGGARSRRGAAALLSALALALAGACRSPAAEPGGAPPPPDPETGVWDYLAARYDRDGSRSVEPQEYTRGAVKFARLDRDRNGLIEPRDFGIPGERVGRRELAAQWTMARAFQRDRDRRNLGRGELLEGFDRHDRDGDGRLTPADAAAKGGLTARALEILLAGVDLDRDGAVSRWEVVEFFRDHDTDGNGVWTFGASRAGLPPGTPAPDFSLPAVDRSGRIALSSLLEEGVPVALVFGCFT